MWNRIAWDGIGQDDGIEEKQKLASEAPKYILRRKTPTVRFINVCSAVPVVTSVVSIVNVFSRAKCSYFFRLALFLSPASRWSRIITVMMHSIIEEHVEISSIPPIHIYGFRNGRMKLQHIKM